MFLVTAIMEVRKARHRKRKTKQNLIVYRLISTVKWEHYPEIGMLTTTQALRRLKQEEHHKSVSSRIAWARKSGTVSETEQNRTRLLCNHCKMKCFRSGCLRII